MDVRVNNRAFQCLAAVLLGTIGVWSIRHSLFDEKVPRFATARVALADVEETVLASGTIQPSKLVSVGAQASGRVIAMRVTVGAHVTKGQLLAEIDPAPQRNALETAEAVLAQERAQRSSRSIALQFAQLAFRRAAATRAQDASSQADYENAEATYRVAKADVDALDAQIRQAVIAVDTARVTLDYTKVIAPMDGTIVAIVTPEGQTVNAVQAAPTIVKLADLDTMTVKAQISEADVIRVRPGQKVYFTVLGAPQHRYYATLRTVEPAPESLATDLIATAASASPANNLSTAIYYNGLFEIANHDQTLRTSMTAQVRVILSEARNGLAIPTAALGRARDDGRRLVQVADGIGNVQLRWVRVGITDSSNTQVLDGLEQGERVVIDASHTISDGTDHSAGAS
jgi:membrane fusion protein, macrolide-specific efflux system